MANVNETQLRYLEYLHREDNYRHHHYDEEMQQYYLLKAGDPAALEEARRMWGSDLVCRASDDPLRNRKYIFVAAVTLACRFAILGGLGEQRSYDISDLYIRQADRCTSLEQLDALHADMFAFYLREVAASKRKRVFSKPVLAAMDFIRYHLHEKLSARRVAEAVSLSPSYLSALFKKELALSLPEYILGQRMEAARNMLRFSEMPYDEIASVLAFSSQSHFIQAFKKATGFTPKAYRDMAYPEVQQGEQGL